MAKAADTMNETLQEILDSEVQLPSLPGTGIRLLELAQQPINDIDISKLSGLIEADPTLYARVLQLANSAYYRTIHKVTDVHQAIVHIGLEEVLYSIQWLFYQNLLPTFPALKGFNAKGYWDHAWACAAANKMLGSHPGLQTNVPAGELYLAGLFHGTGKLILALYQPEKFQQCLNNSRDYSLPLAESEQEIFGITDTVIASQVLQSWNFPASICAAVQYYTAPMNADPEYQKIAALTQFSYYIANTSGVGNSGDEFCFDVNETVIVQKSNLLAEEWSPIEIAQDIHATLRKRVETVIGDEKQTASHEPVAEKLANIQLVMQKKTSRKKSLWEWLCSLWNGLR